MTWWVKNISHSILFLKYFKFATSTIPLKYNFNEIFKNYFLVQNVWIVGMFFKVNHYLMIFI